MRAVRAIVAVLAALAVPGALAPAALARSSTLTGVVELQHADPKSPSGPPRFVLELRTVRRAYELRLAGRMSLAPGSYVRVRGTRRGGRFRVRSARRLRVRTRAVLRLVRAASLATAPPAPTLAVIMINFSNDRRQPFSKAVVASTLFGTGGSVADYYAEQSWDQTMLTGTVFGWFTIPATNAGCDYTTWASQALAAAHLPAGYTHVMYLFPEVDSCAWAGLGDIAGPETWINGFVSLRVMGHELGHNFGVHHANAWECRASGLRVALNVDAGCSTTEYGDPFSIMGAGSTRQFPAYHKDELGWLQPTGTLTVTASGTYAIAADELESAATHQLRIVRGSSALYIDVRQPYGTSFDNFLPGTGPVTGVLVRRGPLDYDQTQPSLIDATPGTATFSDAALTPGNSITDPAGGATITTDAITAGGAIVTIALPGSADHAPSVPGNVTATPVGGGSPDVDLAWTAATDDGTVIGYRVYRNGVQIAAPAGTSFHDPAGHGRFSYGVSAVDDQNQQSAVAGPAPVSVGDTTPPTVPAALTATVTGGQVRLTWASSTDDLAVSGYRVYRGAGVLASVATASDTDTTGHPGAAYSYSVAAVDGAGNVSPRSALVPVRIPDMRPPAGVPGLRVHVARTPWGATLTWGAATDDVGVTGYRIYREAALIRTVAGRTYTDPGLPHGEMSVYAVAAVDAAGHEGPRARIAAVPPPDDTVAPTAPRNLRAKALARRHVRLSWSAAFDAFGVTRYRVQAPGAVVGLTRRTITVTVKGRRGRRVTILVYAFDDAGNRSVAARVRVKLR